MTENIKKIINEYCDRYNALIEEIVADLLNDELSKSEKNELDEQYTNALTCLSSGLQSEMYFEKLIKFKEDNLFVDSYNNPVMSGSTIVIESSHYPELVGAYAVVIFDKKNGMYMFHRKNKNFLFDFRFIHSFKVLKTNYL